MSCDDMHMIAGEADDVLVEGVRNVVEDVSTVADSSEPPQRPKGEEAIGYAAWLERAKNDCGGEDVDKG